MGRWLILVVALLGSCGGDGPGGAGPNTGNAGNRGGTGKVDAAWAPVDAGPGDAGADSWTVFIYGSGDNNLSAGLFRDLAEMVSADLGSSVRLVVMADWDSTRTIPGTKERFPSGYFVYLLEGSEPTLEVVDSGAELSLDDPAVLSAGAAFAFTRYPAAHHGVILWDHGGAWSGGFGLDTQNGTTGGSSMSAETLAAALNAGLRTAGLSGERPLDFVSFDACLMAGAETIAAFSSLAKTFIGNAEIDYGDGWDYAATFTWLAQHSGATALELAAQEVAIWDAHHAAAGVNDALLRSHVALDLSKYPAFAQASKAFADAVAAGHAADFSKAAYRSMPGYAKNVASQSTTTLRDLGQIARSAAGSGLDAAAAGVSAAVKGMRLGMSPGDYRTGQDGVNVEANPARDLDPARLARYGGIAASWEAATGWGAALAAVVASADTLAPTVTGTATVPASPGPTAPPRVDFQVGDPDVMFAEVSLAHQHPQHANVVLLDGYLNAAFIDPGRYTFNWTGAQWSLLATPANVLVSMEPWTSAVASDGSIALPIFAVRGHMEFSSGENLACALLVDAETLQAPAAVFELSGASNLIPLSDFYDIDPNVLFVPEMTAIDAASGKVSDWSGELGVHIPQSGILQIQATPAPAGTYVILVSAYDHWANEALASFALTLSAPVPR